MNQNSSKEEVLALIPQTYFREIRKINDALKDDSDVMYAAVEHNPNAFEFASPRLRDDEKLTTMAVSGKGMGFLLRFGRADIGFLIIINRFIRKENDMKKIRIDNYTYRLKNGNAEIFLLTNDEEKEDYIPHRYVEKDQEIA